MMSETPVFPGLYIGGLRNDLHPGKLAGLICSLLWKCQVQVPKKDIHITFKPNSAYAIVDLQNEETSKTLLFKLSSLQNVQNFFDLATIADNPSNIRIGPRLTQNLSRSRSRSRPRRKKKKDNAAVNSASDLVVDRSVSPNPGQSQHSRSASNRFHDRSVSPRPRQLAKKHGDRSVSPRPDHVTNTNKDVHRQTSTKRETSPPKDNKARQKTAINNKANRNQSNTSLYNSDRDSNSHSESDTESDYGAASRSASKVFSTSSQESGERLHEQIGAGLPRPGQVSAQTSTPETATGKAIGFYRLGQLVGRESRHSEFKQGGMTHKDRTWLQETVGKYVCGFLNSGEGGTLYIGVNDKGMVTGFSCPQNKEDNYRLLIDEALKSIEPSLFTDAYVVRFVPIMENNGKLSDTLLVLEIEVKEIRRPKYLYDFRGNAFLRRDGSLQGPLKARQVQEWTRQQMEREHSGSLLKSQLRDLTSELVREREKTACMQRQLMELEVHISELTSQLALYGHRFNSRSG